MKLKERLEYHLLVSGLGRAALRAQRVRDRVKLATSSAKRTPPPLTVLPWFKELVSTHYLSGRHWNKVGKVAWVTSGAPVEYLKALGYFIHYPENHAAICGVRRVSSAISEEAERLGYSRDLCSYARTDIGAALSGKNAVGGLPRPDLLVCCTNICQTVLAWYRVLAHHFQVPLVLIDTPFLYDEAREHDVAFVKAQIEDAIQIAERTAHRTLSPRRLEEVVALSREAAFLWLEIMNTGRHKPAPLTVFDQFILMGPIVEMRGEESTVRFYSRMLKELRTRCDRGVAAVPGEKTRLLWDNLPIWHKVRPLSKLLAGSGAACVASTYTNAWGELAGMMQPRDPIEGMARVYLHPILNRSTGHKLETMSGMIRDFSLSGAILHSDRSCKPYSLGQIDQRRLLVEQLGVPALLLEADHNDERVFSEEQIINRVQAFLEQLEG